MESQSKDRTDPTVFVPDVQFSRGDQRDIAQMLFRDCLATFDKAQKEYTLTDNPFDNFERLAEDLDISREKVLWVFFKKHLDGILNYINGHQTQREPIQGRIMDAIVYLTLLYGMYYQTGEATNGNASTL